MAITKSPPRRRQSDFRDATLFGSYQTLTVNLTAGARTEYLNGRKYWVAPLTLIVPGVLPGSKGPLFYPPSEIARNISDWDGMPLTVMHPFHPLTNEGLSATDDGVYDRQGIGFIRKPRISNGRNGKLRGTLQADGWFDIERTRKIEPRVAAALNLGQRVELSTGLYTENEPVPNGTHHNGRPYFYIARNYRPDHVAILVDQVGACSINDGCGVFNVSTDDPDCPT